MCSEGKARSTVLPELRVRVNYEPGSVRRRATTQEALTHILTAVGVESDELEAFGEFGGLPTEGRPYSFLEVPDHVAS